MSLQEINRDGLRRAFKRRRKYERRKRRNERAWRFGQYTGPLAALLAAVAALAGRIFR